MDLDSYKKLSDYISTDGLAKLFDELLTDAAAHPEWKGARVIGALHELSDRQWHTYERLSPELRKRVAQWIVKHWTPDSINFITSAAFIAGSLGLPEVLSQLEASLAASPDNVKDQIRSAIRELKPSIDDPFSGIRRYGARPAR